MAKTALQLIADAVAKKHKITVKEAEKFVSAIFDVVNEGLKTDKLVKVKGLGTFKVQAVKPRESVNVNTGERVLIEGHEKVSFTPDATMKEVVNKPFAQFETVVLNDGVDFADIESKSDDEEKAENTDEIVVSAEEKVETKEEITAEIIDEQPAEEVPQQAVEIPMVAVEAKEEIAEEREEEQKESVEEKETVVEVKAETVEEQPEQVAEVPKVNAFPIEKPKKINWLLWSSVAFAVIAVMYFFGYKFGKDAALRDNKMAIRTQAEDSLAQKTKTTAKQAATNTGKTTAKDAQQATDEAEKYKKMSSDKRIRYGAYDIVGIEKTVVLKKGQTMQSYSRRALGPDMVGYFQVLNNATTMSAGDTMKVPKVELRPQYRTK